jgi:hypothetical protein
LIDALRESEDATTFASRLCARTARPWGQPEPSERRPGGLQVRFAEGPFTEMHIRPWSATTSGVVDVDLRPDHAPRLAWADVEDWFGPFYAMAVPDARQNHYAVHLQGPDGGAAVLLMVEVSDGFVAGISLRRDPPEL